jgi:DNA-binding transcriptional MerR regulator
MQAPDTRSLKVGDLARRTGKSVRALHLYEELGLLTPATRSDGGFRLYGADAEARVYWISKLQDLGFTLAQIGELLRTVEASRQAPQAMEAVRELFRARREETRVQVRRLQELEQDLSESLAYLEGCRSCDEQAAAPVVCATCDSTHAGRHPQPAPDLVAGIRRGPPPSHAERGDRP